MFSNGLFLWFCRTSQAVLLSLGSAVRLIRTSPAVPLSLWSLRGFVLYLEEKQEAGSPRRRRQVSTTAHKHRRLACCNQEEKQSCLLFFRRRFAFSQRIRNCETKGPKVTRRSFEYVVFSVRKRLCVLEGVQQSVLFCGHQAAGFLLQTFNYRTETWRSECEHVWDSNADLRNPPKLGEHEEERFSLSRREYTHSSSCLCSCGCCLSPVLQVRGKSPLEEENSDPGRSN